MKTAVYKSMLLAIAFGVFATNVCLAEDQGMKNIDELGQLDEETTKRLKLLFDLLQDKKISVDAGWEFFAAISQGEKRVKFLTFINILQAAQTSEVVGLVTHKKSLFTEECRKILNFDLGYMLKNFSYPDQGKGDFFSLNARKLLIELGKPEK